MFEGPNAIEFLFLGLIVVLITIALLMRRPKNQTERSKNTFHVSSTLQQAWHVTVSNWRVLLVVWVVAVSSFFICILAIGAVESLLPSVATVSSSMQTLIELLFALLGITVLVTLLLGLMHIALRLMDDRPTSWRHVFSGIPHSGRMLIASLLFWFGYLLGLSLFVFPGIVFATTFVFFPFSMGEDEVGPLAALKKSSDVTYGARWNVFVLLFILLVINCVGGLTLIGLLVTVPLSFLSMASAYRKLQEDDQ